VQTVPNGIDVAAVRDVSPTERDVDVLFVGRFIEEKNVGLLVRAVARLETDRPDVQCVLVGDGPEREAVASLVRDLGLEDNVTILPPREEYETVLALMSAADVFALPSRREGFGITALEALACGTPVVTINHPGNAAQELVADGVTGAVCEPTPQALAERIRTLPDETSSADCTGAARDYEWDRIARRMEAVYEGRSERRPESSGRKRPEVRLGESL
jgi:glycosyltransferase involved in cell wall biosynthesis